MSRDKILAKLPRMSAACLRANGLTQPPAVDMSHDPHDVRGGQKPRLRQDRKGMNKTEAEFLAYLRENTPKSIAIHREGLGMRIGNGSVYWPDFVSVDDPFGMVCVYEVKGFMRDDAAVKIKAAARMFPTFKFFLVTKHSKRDGGGWRIEEVLP